MNRHFTIDKVAWVTRQPGNDTPREVVIRTMWAFVDFLQKNDLCNGTLAESISDVDDDEFSVQSEDLTEDGLAVVKLALDKWHRAIDRGALPENVRLLERALVNLRASQRSLD